MQPSGRGSSGRVNAPVDSLRLTEDQWQALLASLNSARPFSGVNLRKEERFAYPVKDVVVQVHHPGGSSGNYLVCLRNLTSRGAAFLHGSYCHAGTPVQLSLRAIDGSIQQLSGRVSRCRHIQGVVHEAAVHFDQPIEVEQYVASESATAAPE